MTQKSWVGGYGLREIVWVKRKSNCNTLLFLFYHARTLHVNYEIPFFRNFDHHCGYYRLGATEFPKPRFKVCLVPSHLEATYYKRKGKGKITVAVPFRNRRVPYYKALYKIRDGTQFESLARCKKRKKSDSYLVGAFSNGKNILRRRRYMYTPL
jgi:hypothetical protein